MLAITGLCSIWNSPEHNIRGPPNGYPAMAIETAFADEFTKSLLLEKSEQRGFIRINISPVITNISTKMMTNAQTRS